jgi:hypothetical protein
MKECKEDLDIKNRGHNRRVIQMRQIRQMTTVINAFMFYYILIIEHWSGNTDIESEYFWIFIFSLSPKGIELSFLGSTFPPATWKTFTSNKRNSIPPASLRWFINRLAYPISWRSKEVLRKASIIFWGTLRSARIRNSNEGACVLY